MPVDLNGDIINGFLGRWEDEGVQFDGIFGKGIGLEGK